MTSTQKILGVLFLMGVVAFSACGREEKKNPVNSQQGTVSENEFLPQSSPSRADGEVYIEARKTGDLTLCKQIVSEKLRVRCEQGN